MTVIETTVSADIDIKGGLGNRFQHGIDPDHGTWAEPGHARRTDRPKSTFTSTVLQMGDKEPFLSLEEVCHHGLKRADL